LKNVFPALQQILVSNTDLVRKPEIENTMIQSGAFYFLFTYIIAPILVWVCYAEGNFLFALLWTAWWMPMIVSAVCDWRWHHFGYESRFSKIWFWGGVFTISLIHLIFFKTH
jgi:hypothetical protein